MMSETILANNDYAKALYSDSALRNSDAVSSLQEADSKAVDSKGKAKDKVSLQVPPGKTVADVAESHELGVLPEQKAVDLKEASLYKDMLSSLPSKLGFDMSAVMQTIFKSMVQMAQSQSQARMSDLLMVGTAYKQAASEMRSGAAMELTGSVLSSGMQLVGAGISMAGTAYSAKSSGLEYTQSMKPFTVGNELLNSSGSVLKGGMDYAGKLQEANSTLSKAAATHAQALRENEDELFKEVNKFVDQMLQIIQSIENQQHAASSQILSA